MKYSSLLFMIVLAFLAQYNISNLKLG